MEFIVQHDFNEMPHMLVKVADSFGSDIAGMFDWFFFQFLDNICMVLVIYMLDPNHKQKFYILTQ